MENYLLLNLVEIITLATITFLTLKSYFATKNKKILLGSIAFGLFFVSAVAIFLRNLLDIEGFLRIIFYFLDFGYLTGMILLLGVYKK
ncbi:hypothetical protein GOV04_03280 [Candidatus Woesearchaeota archaeon]|nr:hypothetical protein [Candidatus Woesearchaeota archaeon]